MKYRVNFDNRQQMKEYLEYYKQCNGVSVESEVKVVVTLYRMGWTRGKIIQRTRPHLTEYQIRKVIHSIPCLPKLSRIVRQVSESARHDAMDFIGAYLDMNGDMTKIGGVD